MMEDISYHRHSHHEQYVNANRAFVDRQPLGQVTRFLDVACGDGAVSELLLEKAPSAHLNGIDIDPQQIALIVRRFSALGYSVVTGTALPTEHANGKPVLSFAAGTVEELPFPEQSFDCVVISNAIHLVPDKPKFVQAVSRLLKPGGVFGFNSVFYAGTFADGTHDFYVEWLKRAVAYIDALNAKHRGAGRPEIKRVRGTRRPAFQNVWLSPQDWVDVLTAHGLRAHDVHERELALDAEFFATAGSYGGLAAVLLSGYPVEAAAEALFSTAGEAMTAVGRTTVPRRWLEVWSTKL